jgi:hypothetical protein
MVSEAAPAWREAVASLRIGSMSTMQSAHLSRCEPNYLMEPVLPHFCHRPGHAVMGRCSGRVCTVIKSVANTDQLSWE